MTFNEKIEVKGGGIFSTFEDFFELPGNEDLLPRWSSGRYPDYDNFRFIKNYKNVIRPNCSSVDITVLSSNGEIYLFREDCVKIYKIPTVFQNIWDNNYDEKSRRSFTTSIFTDDDDDAGRCV